MLATRIFWIILWSGAFQNKHQNHKNAPRKDTNPSLRKGACLTTINQVQRDINNTEYLDATVTKRLP